MTGTDEAAGPREAGSSGADAASAAGVSPEPTPAMTIPLGIASHFQRPAGERSAVLLLDADGHGAPEAAVELATALARSGHRIVLCDLSLSAPALHRVLGVPNDEGMTDLFVFGASLRRVTTAVRDGALFFAPAGVGVPDPERIAAHPRWDRLLAGAADAHATLLLFAPADLPGVGRIASRVGYAAVLGGASEAEDAVARLPADCALLDRIPTRAADEEPVEAEAEAVEAEPDGVDAEAEEVEEEAAVEEEFDPVAAAVEAAGGDLAGFSPFDDEPPEAPAGSAPQSGAGAVAVTEPPTGDEVELAAPEEVPATPSPASSAVTTAADPTPVPPRSSDPSASEPAPPEAAAPKSDAVASPADAEAGPDARSDEAGERPAWTNRLGLTAVVALLVALLLALIWLATVFLAPDADAGAAGAAEEPLAEAPTVANGAIPAVPEGGEVIPLGFTVAIEAHEDLATARERLARLTRAEDDMPFLITPYLLDGVVYYRVMAGPYADSAEAVVVRDILYQDGRKPTVGEWDVRPTAFGFLLDELDSEEAARVRAAELMDAGIPTYPVAIAPDGATRLYAGAFELREQGPVLEGPLANAGLDPALVRISGWVAER